MIIASFKYTTEFWLESLARFRQQQRGRWGLFFETFFALVVLAIAGWLFSTGSKLASVLFFTISIFFFISNYFERWTARRNFSKLPDSNQNYVLELSEEGFHIKLPKPEETVPWSVFTKVVHFKDGFLLLKYHSRFFTQLQTPRLFNWLPFSALVDSKQKLELQNLLREKIKVHEVIEK